jgi:hypothetical protein
VATHLRASIKNGALDTSPAVGVRGQQDPAG